MNEISGIRLSTVVPASITTGETTHQLTNTDLAFKLHHITTVHFFTEDAARNLTISNLKAPMFYWLEIYNTICGRIRRDVDGKPFVKCNDSGVRIVEANCDGKTITEWLQTVNGGDHHRFLVYNQPLVTDNFEFTPLVFLQLTKFKCGGLSVGMRWSHFLGDPFAATNCINLWGSIMASTAAAGGKSIPAAIINPATPFPSSPSSRSLKSVEPLGDNWLAPNNLNMVTHTFHFTQKQISHLNSTNNGDGVSSFELISSVIWKAIGTAEIVTVIRKKGKQCSGLLGNHGLQIGIVEMGVLTNSNVVEIARMMNRKFIDETDGIEGEDRSVNYCLVYGANLTFVDCLDVDLYGLQIKGHFPVFANLSIGGVGDEGAVIIIPAPENGIDANVILPKEKMQQLKSKLGCEDFCNA